MAATNLKCRECGERYPLEALYVCERCFGPLEVAYDEQRERIDLGELRRRIQGGPQNIWRYADPAPRWPAGRQGPRGAWPRAWACPRAARR